jgi:hypothetical protein
VRQNLAQLMPETILMAEVRPDDHPAVRREPLIGEGNPDGRRRNRFELFGEVRTQPFPRGAHPEEVTALAAFAPRQATGDLAAVLKHLEMPPSQGFGVVVAKCPAAVFRAAHRFPEPLGFPNLQKDRATLVVETAFGHFPVQPQTQQFMKPFFRCHPQAYPTTPPKTAKNLFSCWSALGLRFLVEM